MLRGLEAAESDAVLLAPSEDAVAKERTGALLQIEIMSRAELEDCPQWQHLYAHERKDRRYYEIVENTIDQGFDYGYFVLKDEAGQIRAIQPFFVNDQDMLGGTSPQTVKLMSKLAYPFDAHTHQG